jgi:hypothetical protein
VNEIKPLRQKRWGFFYFRLAVATALLPSEMIWSDLAVQGANLKNSFLEELQTLAEGVKVRLDWENPQSYPDAQSTDSAMWAWEFLRRNRHYVRDFDSFVKKKDQEVHDRLAVAWGISRLADPGNSYSELREEDVNIKSAFLFDGSEPYVVFPYYSKSEFIEQACPNGRRLPDPTELTMLLAPNQIAVILNLDGNIQLQIDSLLAQLKQPKTSGQSSRDTRCFVFEVDASGNQPSGDSESHLIGFEHEYPTVRVHLSHLWLALRCLDAMDVFQSPSTVISSKYFVDQLVAKFNAELVSGDSAASPLKKNPHENWRRQEIVDALRYGLRYGLSMRHITVASTDLESQAKKWRSIKKKPSK